MAITTEDIVLMTETEITLAIIRLEGELASRGKLGVGSKIRKLKGYSFDGEVRAVFHNSKGELRYVCELEGENGGGMLHIFAPSQIERRT